MSENIIEVKALTKSYGDFYAVKDVSFNIKKGGIYGLIGENGAGKTTLIRMLAGLIYKTSGEIKMYGKSDEKSLVEARKKASIIVETPYYVAGMTAYQNLNLQRMQRGIKDKSRINKALELVGLEYTGKKNVGKFSLGMRQRLGIAIAMLGNTEILVLDEPTNGLDPMGIIEMRKLIKRLNKEFGVTVIVSSHILSELALTVTDYLFMKNGSMIKQVSADELKKECGQRYTLNTSDNKKVEAILNKCGIGYINKENKLILLGETDVKKFSKELFDNNIYIYEFFESTLTLEQYYLSLIGEVKE